MVDVIIATYNRIDKAIELSNALLQDSNDKIHNIILIDSSDTQVELANLNSKVTLLFTTVKNQPYQRYLGYQKSTSPILLFLDDDMELATQNCIRKIDEYFQKNQIVGLAINFTDKHNDTSLNALAPSAFTSSNSSMIRIFFNWFTAYPQLPDGVFGKCGVRGKQPSNGGNTSFVSGGAFAARREALYQNFNFQLFDLYNQKIGKGEDAITGYTLSKIGPLHYYPELLFYHNDQKDSAYSIDQYAYSKRVTFSRIYLSLEKSRLDKENYFLSKFHYHWHTLWRVSGLVLNYFHTKSSDRKGRMMGAIHGWQASFKFNFFHQTKPTII